MSSVPIQFVVNIISENGSDTCLPPRFVYPTPADGAQVNIEKYTQFTSRVTVEPRCPTRCVCVCVCTYINTCACACMHGYTHMHVCVHAYNTCFAFYRYVNCVFNLVIFFLKICIVLLLRATPLHTYMCFFTTVIQVSCLHCVCIIIVIIYACMALSMKFHSETTYKG